MLKLKKKLRILFVDDSSDICVCSKILLESRIYAEVTICTSSKDAFTLLEDNEYDILMADICMPDIDGLQLAEFAIKEYKLPVILVTGHAVKDYMNLGVPGIICCISKPYNVTEIKEKIIQTLKVSSKWKEFTIGNS